MVIKNVSKEFKKLGILIFFIFIFFETNYAQQQLLPLGNHFRQQTDFELNKANISINTGFKPLLKSELNNFVNIDSVIYDYEKIDKFFTNHKRNWVWRKLLFEDFISVNKDNFSIYVNPLFYMEKGIIGDTSNFFINTRGIEIKGDIGKKISYYSSFRENQTRFRSYIYDWSRERLVVPGQGALKKNNNDLRKFDFSQASAYLSFTPYNWLNIQIGQDKNFIGEGHRSLLLSDNAFNYPFAKLSFNYKSLKYVTMFTEFRDFEGAYYHYHFKKHGAFNYLSYNFKNRFEIGLFEGVIYRTTDTSAYINKFKADYFIPVPGVRTAVNGFGSEHNVITGLNAKVKISNFIQLYGQFVADDPSQRKLACQGGLKIFDVLHSSLDNHLLFFQAEFNKALPRTYSHQNLKYQTWTHYNQEFAHPTGSDFKEIVIKLNYKIFNFFLNYNFIGITLNNKSSFSDICILDEDNYLMMPEPYTVMHNSISFGYTINPRTGLQLYAGIDQRNILKETKSVENYFMFGIRTSLSNFYYDF